MYSPSEKFPVNIAEEKELYLSAMVRVIIENSCISESYDGAGFTFDKEIEKTYRELSAESGTKPYFKYLYFFWLQRHH